MDTIKLRYFTVVAQTENIRRAAELLNVTPSALSKSLKSLEDDLDTKLLTPLGRGIMLTGEGRRFADDASRILKDLESLGARLKDERKVQKEKPVRIATFEVFSTYFLRALDKVKWPERGLVIHEVVPGELERAVEQGQADLGITYMPIPYKNVEHVKICSIEMGVFKRKGSFTGHEQQDLPFVVPVHPLSGTPTRVRGLDGWPEDAYNRRVLFEVTLMESALELCRQGRSAGYFPSFVVEEHNRKLKSEFALERHPSPYGTLKCFSDVYIVKRKDRSEDALVKLFARMLRVGCV
jgi:DNA-binding transcriptional LysR family regulator